MKKAIFWLLFGNGNSKNCFTKESSKTIIYRLLGVFTIGYITLQLYLFHTSSSGIVHNLGWFWMLWLLSYAVVKEAFRWTKMSASEHRGEIFAVLIVIAFLWMEGVNIFMQKVHGTPMLLPHTYFESTVWAILLLTSSNISHAIYHCVQKKNTSA